MAEGYVERAVSIKGAAIEADVLVERFEEKDALVGGGVCFARHGPLGTVDCLTQSCRVHVKIGSVPLTY